MSSSPIGSSGPQMPQVNLPSPPPTAAAGKVGSGGKADQSAQPEQQQSWEDPTGTWAKFLGGSGSPASPKEVEMFINTLMKFFSNVIFQQMKESSQRANRQLKDAIEGND